MSALVKTFFVRLFKVTLFISSCSAPSLDWKDYQASASLYKWLIEKSKLEKLEWVIYYHKSLFFWAKYSTSLALANQHSRHNQGMRKWFLAMWVGGRWCSTSNWTGFNVTSQNLYLNLKYPWDDAVTIEWIN